MKQTLLTATALSLGVGGLLGGFAQVADAAPYGYSTTTTKNTAFIDRGDNNALQLSDFRIINDAGERLVGNVSGNNGAALNGTNSGSENDVGNVADVDPIDPLQASVPSPSPVAENSFGTMNTGAGEFSRADGYADGSVLDLDGNGVADGLGTDLDGVGGADSPNGARASTEAEFQVTETGTNRSATANANFASRTQLEFEFALEGSDQRDIRFIFDADSEVFASLGAFDDGTVQANRLFALTITDVDAGQEAFSWNPNGIIGDQPASSTGSVTGVNDFADDYNLGQDAFASGASSTDGFGFQSGSFGLDFTLTEGTRYRVALDQVNNTTFDGTVAVPLPGTLALLGSGLMLLGFAGVWRTKTGVAD